MSKELTFKQTVERQLKFINQEPPYVVRGMLRVNGLKKGQELILAHRFATRSFALNNRDSEIEKL
jgi:hypothetical protein